MIGQKSEARLFYRLTITLLILVRSTPINLANESVWENKMLILLWSLVYPANGTLRY